MGNQQPSHKMEGSTTIEKGGKNIYLPKVEYGQVIGNGALSYNSEMKI